MYANADKTQENTVVVKLVLNDKEMVDLYRKYENLGSEPDTDDILEQADYHLKQALGRIIWS